MSEGSNNPASSGASTPSSVAQVHTSAAPQQPQQQQQQQPVTMQLQQPQLQQQQQLQMTQQQLQQLQQQMQQQQQQQPMQMQQQQIQQMNQQLQQQHLQQQQQPMQMLGGMGSTNQPIMHGSAPAYSMSSAGQMVRSNMPGTMGMQAMSNMPGMGLGNVQVIQQPQFLPHQYLQQQQQPQHIMLQQAIQGIPQHMNLVPQQQQQATMQQQQQQQQQSQSKSPGMASPTVSSQQQVVSSTGMKMVTSSVSGTSMAPGIVTFTSRGALSSQQVQQQVQQAGKGAGGVQLQPGNKLSQIRPGQAAPLVIGQIGMVSSMAGTAGSPLLTNSLRFTSTSPLPANPTNPAATLLPTAPAPALTGQIVGNPQPQQQQQQQAQQLAGGLQQIPGSPTVLSMSQFQNMGFATCTNNIPTLGSSPQMLSCTQGTAIYNSQPLYIRPLHQQQQQQQLINMQQQQQQVTTATASKQQQQQQQQVVQAVVAAAAAGNPQQQQQQQQMKAAAAAGAAAAQPQQTVVRSVANILPQQVRALAPTSSPQVKQQGGKAKAAAPVKPKPPSSPSSSATQVKIAPLPTVTVTPKVRPTLQTTLTNTVASTGSDVVLTSVTAMTTTTSSSPATTTPVTTPLPQPPASSSISSVTTTVTSISTSRAVTLPERKTELTLFPADKAGDGVQPVVVNGSEKKQAIVKPVLTHVIEGFVIQEATTPFPVQRSNLMLTELPVEPEKPEKIEDPPSPVTSPPVTDQPTKKHTGPKRTCEFCRKTDYASKFRRSKRFCSLSCAKRYNVGCSKRMGLVKGENNEATTPTNIATPDDTTTSTTATAAAAASGGETEDGSSSSSSSSSGNSSGTGDEQEDMDASSVEATSVKDEDEDNSSAPRSPPTLVREVAPAAPTPAPTTPAAPAPSNDEEDLIVPPKHPRDWTVDDVYHFIRTLPGCGPYSDEFLRQEIDGQALLLLKEDHLMTTMNMRLGPALKICAKINSLKEDRS